MMLYQHVNLVLKPDHAGFDAFQTSLKSFHVAPLLFEEQLYAEHGLAVRHRLHATLQVIHSTGKPRDAPGKPVVLILGRKAPGQVLDPPAVHERRQYPEHRPPAVKLSQDVGHWSLHYIR